MASGKSRRMVEMDDEGDEHVISRRSYGKHTPITTQPASNATLKGTVAILAPPGLEPLLTTTHLHVKQCVEILEIATGFETGNKYEILNSLGERIYFAIEETNWCIVCCCKTNRCYSFKVINHLGKIIFRIKHPCTCCCCCCPCCICGNGVYITLADGTRLGSVDQVCACCTPKFVVSNENAETVLKIKGPACGLCSCCKCRLCGVVQFNILGPDGVEPQGSISKQFAGLAQELLTDADNYGVSFAAELDPKLKAVLLGAVIMIDFLYFEDDGKGKKHQTPGGEGV